MYLAKVEFSRQYLVCDVYYQIKNPAYVAGFLGNTHARAYLVSFTAIFLGWDAGDFAKETVITPFLQDASGSLV